MPVADLLQSVADLQAAPDVAKLRAYYAAQQSPTFGTPAFRTRYRWMIRQSRENLLPAVVRAFTDLKQIEDWTNADAAEDADRAGWGRLASFIHRDEYRAGNAFTITWRDPAGVAKAVYQRPEQIVPHVDEANPDVLDYATRLWVAGGYARANVYYADRVERFVSRLPLEAGGETLRSIPDAAIGWAPYEDAEKAILRHNFGAVPVCWWKRDADDPWSWGRSILENAIPVQDELDYLVSVTNAAVERIARPIRYALANEKISAPDGNVDFDPTREDILTLVASSAGEFAGPAVEGLIALQAHAEQKLARVTGIPPYVFSQASGDTPSGVALRLVNERRTSQVMASNADDTPVWRGQMALLGYADVEPVWADPMKLTELEAAELAAIEKNDLGLPADVWLRTAGYDPDAIDAQGVRLADRVQATAQQLGQAFLNGDTPATYGE